MCNYIQELTLHIFKTHVVVWLPRRWICDPRSSNTYTSSTIDQKGKKKETFWKSSALANKYNNRRNLKPRQCITRRENCLKRPSISLVYLSFVWKLWKLNRDTHTHDCSSSTKHFIHNKVVLSQYSFLSHFVLVKIETVVWNRREMVR